DLAALRKRVRDASELQLYEPRS
ncbi:MAG: hypothetical protein QOI16_2594, partial [Pseudonocardiales bacterium]|nr:hypothetical protein [Pseudonocardiales bacterium]